MKIVKAINAVNDKFGNLRMLTKLSIEISTGYYVGAYEEYNIDFTLTYRDYSNDDGDLVRLEFVYNDNNKYHL